MRAGAAATLFGFVLCPVTGAAQAWNADSALVLVERAIARRAAQEADTALKDYRARAHGFVFFLAQLGEGFADPPRLVKADQLELEVYWRAPLYSKQRIIGWRDRTDLPTDIQYHRDHLGVVQNNFGDRIRLGQGDEVQDVPHPLAREAPLWYDYALERPTTLRLPDREVRVREIRVRPKDFGAPRVVGSLYVDLQSAELVLFRFTFTRSAYRDPTLEDITIVLENALWEGRWWLPRRQEIEIRRRTAWLDLPARGIIRGRWEIDEYAFNVGLAPREFWGAEIVAAPKAVRDSFPWGAPLAESLHEAARGLAQLDLDAVRGELGGIAGIQAISGLAALRPGIGALSDLAHVNRVEGLALGAGGVVRPDGGPWEIRGAVSYGISDHRLKGRVALSLLTARAALAVGAGRTVSDLGDEPVISPLVNSLLAQELGRDYGDYYFSEHLYTEGWVDASEGIRLRLRISIERTSDMAVAATPASGSYRPNPPLGSGRLTAARLEIARRGAVLDRGGIAGAVGIEGGAGEGRDYVRLDAALLGTTAVGRTELVGRVRGAWGSAGLPVHRHVVWGGRGTLVGEAFRAYGGRYGGWGTLEWRVPVPFPALDFGAFVSTGREIVVAPFIGAGWSGGATAGQPWVASGGVRPVVGVAVEWFHRLFRIDAGMRLRDPGVSVIVDVSRDLWTIL